MRWVESRDGKLLVNDEAPEPLPSIVRIIEAVEWPSENLIQIGSLLFTVGSVARELPTDFKDLVIECSLVLYAYLSDWTISRVKYIEIPARTIKTERSAPTTSTS